jgi:hypothetical protein
MSDIVFGGNWALFERFKKPECSDFNKYPDWLDIKIFKY